LKNVFFLLKKKLPAVFFEAQLFCFNTKKRKKVVYNLDFIVFIEND